MSASYRQLEVEFGLEGQVVGRKGVAHLWVAVPQLVPNIRDVEDAGHAHMLSGVPDVVDGVGAEARAVRLAALETKAITRPMNESSRELKSGGWKSWSAPVQSFVVFLLERLLQGSLLCKPKRKMNFQRDARILQGTRGGGSAALKQTDLLFYCPNKCCRVHKEIGIQFAHKLQLSSPVGQANAWVEITTQCPLTGSRVPRDLLRHQFQTTLNRQTGRQTHTHTHTHTHMQAQTDRQTHTHMQTQTHRHTHADTDAHTHTHTRERRRVRCVCVCVCVRA